MNEPLLTVVRKCVSKMDRLYLRTVRKPRYPWITFSFRFRKTFEFIMNMLVAFSVIPLWLFAEIGYSIYSWRVDCVI